MAKVLSHFVGVFFSQLTISLAVQKLFSCMKSHLSTFVPNSLFLFRKSFPTHLHHVGHCPCFLYAISMFQLSYLGLWYLWRLCLCKVIDMDLTSFLYMWTSNFPRTILTENVIFPPVCIFDTVVKYQMALATCTPVWVFHFVRFHFVTRSVLCCFWNIWLSDISEELVL